METCMRRMVMPAVLAVVAALAVGCASGPRPEVSLVRFTDTRESIDPSIEKAHLFGRNHTIADWTTDRLAKRIEKAGYAVKILSTDAALESTGVIVSGTVYRWNIFVVKKILDFDGTATSRCGVTVTRNGRVVLDKFYTGDDTEVHASEAVLFYDARRGPLKKAACNMFDAMASDVIAALKTPDAAPAKAPAPAAAPKPAAK